MRLCSSSDSACSCVGCRARNPALALAFLAPKMVRGYILPHVDRKIWCDLAKPGFATVRGTTKGDGSEKNGFIHSLTEEDVAVEVDADVDDMGAKASGTVEVRLKELTELVAEAIPAPTLRLISGLAPASERGGLGIC